MLVPWTALQPSPRARRWRLVGLGIALASFLALLIAAFSSAPFDPALALLAAIAVFAAWASTRGRMPGPLEIGVSSLGEISVRQRDPAPSGVAPVTSPRVQIAFASTWLISLRRGTMLIPVWPDSLPQSTYRRLWVHLRWGRAMPDDDDQRTTARNPANSMDC
ncbi:MAG: hypothetical protein ACXW13_09795 [Burkholderiaceae bacterium]